jgi:hypothetical protein
MVLKRSDRASRAKNQEIQRGTAAVIESHGVETQCSSHMVINAVRAKRGTAAVIESHGVETQ